MKIFGAAVLAVSCMPYSAAFISPQVVNRPAQASKLNLHGKSDGESRSWVGPAATVVAGLTVASHVAGASVGVTVPANPVEIANAAPQMQPVQSASNSVFSGSSLYVSASGGDDFLDFSMPSYGSSVQGSTSKAKVDAPSFNNPFADFDFKLPKSEDSPSVADTESEDKAAVEARKEEDKAATEARKAEDKAAAEARKAEDKAAAEARKAEDKAAAEAKKAEEKSDREAAAVAKKAEKEGAEAKRKEEESAADAKRAEKEARRQVELDKQRAAVERAKEAETAPAPAPAPAPVIPELKLDIPEFKAPDFKLDIPEFKAPEFKAPDIKIPEFSVPKFSMPKLDMPEVPKVDMPKFDAPKIDTPKAQSFSVPQTSFEMPKAPSFSVPQTNFEMPKAPSFSAPQSSSPAEPEEEIEPQEVRDASAKAARSVYKEYDQTAKEVEKKAVELRSLANEKNKVAKEAKDEACKTRFGGRIVCFRPLNSGY